MSVAPEWLTAAFTGLTAAATGLVVWLANRTAKPSVLETPVTDQNLLPFEAVRNGWIASLIEVRHEKAIMVTAVRAVRKDMLLLTPETAPTIQDEAGQTFPLLQDSDGSREIKLNVRSQPGESASFLLYSKLQRPPRDVAMRDSSMSIIVICQLRERAMRTWKIKRTLSRI